ncbi:hypothetical protein KBA41_02210 [Candidatus Ozemobacteraceae bacterium]|nr:hypothetical protein [Candidatus Ozemobacteraceae bacterium]
MMRDRLFRFGAKRTGSTILLALGLGIVLLISIAALRDYSSNRIAASIREWNTLKATSLAEAGLAMAVAEMSQNYNFFTHEVTKDLTWGNQRTISPPPAEFDGVDLTFGENLSGSIPKTEGSFEVRCGLIDYPDDTSTDNIDESKAYVYVESIGNFKSTYRKITAVLHRRFPGKECLMYDGDVLSIVFGTVGETGKTNTFSKGNLYGHRGVEVSQILRSKCVDGNDGTKQALDIPLLMSGRGGVFFLSSTKFNGKTIPPSPGWDNPDFKSAGFHYFDSAGQTSTYDKGYYPQEFLNAAPAIPAEAREWTRDKNNPIVMTPALMPHEYYKQLAGGVTPYETKKHPSYTAGEKDMHILDWGDAIRDGNNPPSGSVLYFEEDVVVRGNPTADVTIVSKGDVYIDGDFNQSGGTSKAQKFGYAQDYTNKDPFDVETVDYDGLDPEVYRNHYKTARVIAGGRLIFDYSDPKLVFGNELYPFMQYKIAETIMDDAEKARERFLDCNGTREVYKELTASYTYTTGENGSNETEQKRQALEQARAKLLEKTQGYLATDSGLPWGELKTELEKKISDGPEHTVSTSSTTDEQGNTVSTTITKEIVIKFEAKDDWMEDFSKKKVWNKIESSKLRKTMDDLVVMCEGKTDKKGDYLFFPEMTTVGMFTSFAKRNPHDTYYPGADFDKHFDEMGSFAHKGTFIHRLYGSLTSYRTAEAKETAKGLAYEPPIRKRIYDTTEYNRWVGDAILDVPTFGLMTWRETRADGFTF